MVAECGKQSVRLNEVKTLSVGRDFVDCYLVSISDWTLLESDDYSDLDRCVVRDDLHSPWEDYHVWQF